MFESLELFVGQKIDLDQILNNLAAFHYHKVKKSTQEGEFSQRGGILDVYPIGFDGPIRIDFDDDTIRTIASINLKTGKSIWQKRVGGNYVSSPICIDGKLYGVDLDGNVAVVAASDKYELLARNSLGQPTKATPAVSGGTLYIRTESQVYSIGGGK